MFRSILVPLDGSTYAEQALGTALWIARRGDATLQLIHVRPPDEAGYDRETPPSEASEESAVRSHLQEYLGSLALRLSAESPVDVSWRVAAGPVAVRILEAAEASRSDLIVLTTHGHGGLAPAWLGSVAESVIRQAPIPVLQVRPRVNRVDEAEPAIRRILVPLDGSAESESAIGPAHDLAILAEAEVTLLAVVILPREVGDPPVTMSGSPDPAEEYRRAESYLAELDRRLTREGVATRVAVATSLHPAAAILDAVTEPNASIIVMATHGRSRLRRMSVGSVSDKVLRAAAAPVMLVRPKEAPYRSRTQLRETARA